MEFRRFLKSLGYNVTGSDMLRTRSDRLSARGIQVHIGRAATNLENVDAVIYSSAIVTDNDEF